jgi:hypothetical protein
MARRLAVLCVCLALAGAGAQARADDGSRDDARARRQQRQKEFEKIEEQMLREQLERGLNEAARWDAAKKRIVLREDRAGDLGPMKAPLSAILHRIAEPGEDGQLHVRGDVKLKPFMKVIQDYVADGGLEDIEKLQRLRRDGNKGENPFKDGIPPRMTKAIAGLLQALNDQGKDEGDGEEEAAETRESGPGGASSGKERADRGPLGRLPEGLREELRRRVPNSDELETRLRIAAELAEQARRELARVRADIERQVKDFAESEEGQRLRRRAASELRRLMESEELRGRMAELERRAMAFLESERGQEAQRRFFEFLESDRGRALRKRLDDFLRSDEGRALRDRFDELRRGFDNGPSGRDDRREPRPPARGDDGAKARKKGAKLF